ncbi:UNVERIFIED_CONTAM: hypothetical protein Sradi_2966500 [Sesamum radiatum]|uniref:Integrase zinc-binding domain-containing protein n=1 Tax=Sesamum radiatum TaxID=300843 RepID=A0AAW2S013_SESRA
MNVSQVSTDWRRHLLDYVERGVLAQDEKEAVRSRSRATRFILLEKILYKHSFSKPNLQCVSIEKGRTILQEIHEGVCGLHTGGITLARKTLRARYFCPTLKKDAIGWVRKCELCPKHAPLNHVPAEPFNDWVHRPRHPTAFHINHLSSSQWAGAGAGAGYQPHTYKVSKLNKSRHEDNPDALATMMWSYRTTHRLTTRETPFNLVYGLEAFIPVKEVLETFRI